MELSKGIEELKARWRTNEDTIADLRAQLEDARVDPLAPARELLEARVLQNARLVDALVERGVERACAVDIGEGRWDPLDPLLTPAQRVFDNTDTRGLLLGRWSWGKKGSVGAGEKRWAHGWFHHVGAWEEERNHYLGRLVDAVKEKVEADWVEKSYPYESAHWLGNPSTEEVEATFNSIFMALGDAEEEDEDEEEADEEERFLGYNYFRVGDGVLASLFADTADTDPTNIIELLETALEATLSSPMPDTVALSISNLFGGIWCEHNGFEADWKEIRRDLTTNEGMEHWSDIEDEPPESEDKELSEDNPPRYMKTDYHVTIYDFSQDFPYHLEQLTTCGPFCFEKQLRKGEWEYDDHDECEDYHPSFSYRLIKKK